MASRAEVRLAADAMLGSLARKLRIFGFDTYYHASGTDEELMKLARREKRVILTSDRALSEIANRRGIRSFFILGRNDSERLSRLAEEAQGASLRLEPGVSRCAVCNGALERMDKGRLLRNARAARTAADARRGLHGTAEPMGRHRLYFLCTECGKVYWRGSHWRRLRRLSKLLPAPAKEI